MRHCAECGRRMRSDGEACWHCARQRESDARKATRVSTSVIWSLVNRESHLASLRKVLVPAPDVLYSVRVGHRAYDVVWDGSIR